MFAHWNMNIILLMLKGIQLLDRWSSLWNNTKKKHENYMISMERNVQILTQLKLTGTDFTNGVQIANNLVGKICDEQTSQFKTNNCLTDMNIM